MKQSKRKRADTAHAASAEQGPRADDMSGFANDADTAALSEEAVQTESGANEAPAVKRPESDVIALGPSCTVRDCAEIKSELLDLLTHRQPVTIDVSSIERIDTAAMQVLCAFVRDRTAAGGQVHWTGQAPSFVAAVRLLGLKQALHLPDALLAMGPA